MLQIAHDVNAYYHGIQRGELPGHFDNTKIPAAVTGYEENHMRWLRRLAVNRERPKWTKLNVIFLDAFTQAL